MQQLIDELLEIQHQVSETDGKIKALQEKKEALDVQQNSIAQQVRTVMQRDNIPIIVTKWRGEDVALSSTGQGLRMSSVAYSENLRPQAVQAPTDKDEYDYIPF